MPTPSLSQLQSALRIQEQIDTLEAELKSLLSGAGPSQGAGHGNGKTPAAESKRGGRRKMSAASRARIAAAQKARWAKSKGVAGDTASETSPASKGAKPEKKEGRKMSPEGRARIVAAQKKRWAAFKKAKK